MRQCLQHSFSACWSWDSSWTLTEPRCISPSVHIGALKRHEEPSLSLALGVLHECSACSGQEVGACRTGLPSRHQGLVSFVVWCDVLVTWAWLLLALIPIRGLQVDWGA